MNRAKFLRIVSRLGVSARAATGKVVRQWGWVTPAGFGLGAWGVGEYLAAIILFSASGLVFVLKCAHWETPNIGRKLAAIALALVFIVLLCYGVNIQRGTEPLSKTYAKWQEGREAPKEQQAGPPQIPPAAQEAPAPSQPPKLGQVLPPTPGISARSSTQGSNNTEAIGALSQLGWTIKRDTPIITFAASDKLPAMAESSRYFAQIRGPFRLDIERVPNLEGLQLLGSIKNCRELLVDAIESSDISPLATFKSLQKLEINQIPFHTTEDVDGRPLAEMVGLITLNLDIRISDLSPITKMPHLQTLYVTTPLIRDLSPIGGHAELKFLSVIGSSATDLSSIATDTRLEELEIDSRQVRSLPSIASLPNLHKLELIEMQTAVDLSPIGSLTTLKQLYLDGAFIMNLEFLGKLQNLTSLRVMSMQAFFGPRAHVTGFERLCASPHLGTLALGDLDIPNLGFISQCRELTEVSIRNLPISSVADLASVPTLEKVELANVQVVEISPLLDLPNLQTLGISNVPARNDVISALEQRGVKVTP